MFTAKINRKEDRGGIVEVFVDFTNGTDTYTESCVPQNREGFDYWLKSRLETYNSSIEIKNDLVDGQPVTVTDVVTPPPVLTQEEIDRNTWLEKYFKWVRIKQTIVDTGIVPVTQPKLAAMLQNLKGTLKPEYIDYI